MLCSRSNNFDRKHRHESREGRPAEKWEDPWGPTSTLRLLRVIFSDLRQRSLHFMDTGGQLSPGSIFMALDPRIRVELERLGRGNVRELLRTAAGSGRSAPVAMQLPGVPDPTRGDVEDWLRGKERETERVIGATLKWAKIAGVAAITVSLSLRSSGSRVSLSHSTRRVRKPVEPPAVLEQSVDVMVWVSSRRDNQCGTGGMRIMGSGKVRRAPPRRPTPTRPPAPRS